MKSAPTVSCVCLPPLRLRIDSEICGGWDTDHDDSGIADLARSLGVNLHFTSYIHTCIRD